jgi:gliding motility-associated-like protein
MSGTDVFAVEISLGNCFDDAEVEIDLYDNAECIITEGLSPNTTPGQNDCLDLTFLNDRTGINKLTVYNRYGREIYSESNYTDSWCGQDSNQNIVSTGTYYYVIDIAGDDPVFGSVKKGWIYINREI